MAWSTDTARPPAGAFDGARGAVIAGAAITFAGGALGLRTGFVPSGRVWGLSLPPPPR
jgi:hypothetical protein